MFQDFKTPLAIQLGCSSGVLVCDGLGRVPDPTIRCASNSSCTSDDPCILHSPSFPVERAKLTDPRPKRAAKANGALDRPSQWVERRSMRVLCARIHCFRYSIIIGDRESSPIIIDHYTNQKDPSGLSRVGDLV